MRLIRFSAALLVALYGLSAVANAQDHSTPYVTLGSHLDQLARWGIAQGVITGIDPQVRPFRLTDIAQAVERADTSALPAASRRTLEWLRRELEAGADSSALVAEVALRGYSNGRRDSFRPGGVSGFAPAGGLRGSLRRGAFSAVVNPLFDNRLKDDPEYTGYTTRSIAGMLAEAYLTVSGAPGELLIGRYAQSWGPPGFDGLLVSDVAYPMDGIRGALRLDRFELRTSVERLSDWDTTLAVPVSRWRAAHRLGIRVADGWYLGFTETAVYGGPGRGFEPGLSLPLSWALLAQYNEDQEVNVQLGADLSARLARGVRLDLAGFLDDIQVDDTALTDQRPTSYGLTGTVSWASPRLPLLLSAGYTRIASLTYRNSVAPWYEYSQERVGLGRNFADYDQVLLGAEFRPAAAWTAKLELSYIRQGSGDFRQPFAPDSVLAQPGQGFLVPPVHTAPGVRLNVAGKVRPGLEVVGEAGATRALSGGTEGIGSLSLRLRFDALRGGFGGTTPALPHGSERSWP